MYVKNGQVASSTNSMIMLHWKRYLTLRGYQPSYQAGKRMKWSKTGGCSPEDVALWLLKDTEGHRAVVVLQW